MKTIVHTGRRAVLLRTDTPEQILAVIPTAKALLYKGVSLVAVPHRLDETRVLRSLGYDVPSPVLYYYQWSGQFTPFDHQKTTVEFATLHQRGFMLLDMGCVEGDAIISYNRCGVTRKVTLRDLYRRFHSTNPLRKAGEPWKCRSLMGDRFGNNVIRDVMYRGVKPTLRITLADGKTLRVTPDHEMARPDGTWSAAETLVVGDELVTNGEYFAVCPTCGAQRKFTSAANAKSAAKKNCRKCGHAAGAKARTGEGNPRFHGKPTVDKDGYVRIWMPEHPRAHATTGRVYEHILVAEKKYGRPITTDEHIHHIDENKQNNAPDNLELLSQLEHNRKHDPRRNLDGGTAGTGGKVIVLPKFTKIAAIEPGGEIDVYDLSMDGPHHNFVVNGIVVHNCGKTVSTLWAFDYLRQIGQAKRLLVTAPLSTLERTWADEVFKHFPHLNYCVVHGSADRRRKLLASHKDYDVMIINHHGMKVVEKELVELITAGEIDAMAVDELAVFRNAQSGLWKTANALIPHVKWGWGLTGSPTPNAPTDAYGQVRLLAPHRVPKYFNAFRDKVMRQINQFKWIPKADSHAIITEALQPSIRFKRDECIDLPPTTYETRQVELSTEQKHAYKEMLTHLYAELSGEQVLAVNEAVKASKLLQICCGTVYSTNGEEVVVPAHDRIAEVKELIEQAEGKVIVFVPFTGALHALRDELGKHFSTAMISGEVPKSQRDDIFGSFQNGGNAGYRVLVAQPAAMAHGLTLTAANVVVWFAPVYSNEIYEQANARVTRPGQKRNTLIVHIQGAPIEAKIYNRLRDKGIRQASLLQMIKEEMNA